VTNIQRYTLILTGVFGSCLLAPPTSQAGPNLIALGHYDEIAYRRATGRDSFSEGEIVYRFSDPEFDFGRIVVRSREPLSVVRRDLFVGYDGDGLIVDTRQRSRGGRSTRIESLEVWLRVRGEIRPQRRYRWTMEVSGERDPLQRGLQAVIPAMWVDGEMVAANVTVHNPQVPDDDRIQRMTFPSGTVKTPYFEGLSGAAWIVLQPADFGSYFRVERVLFREIEDSKAIISKSDMPVPVRYVPMRDVLEDRIAEAVTRAAESLGAARGQEKQWPGDSLEESVLLTALAVSALAEIQSAAKTLTPTMHWLAQQVPQGNSEDFSVETRAARLYCLARYGDFKTFRQVIHADIQSLGDAQFASGGWSFQTRGAQSDDPITISADNYSTAMVLRSLREARFAGAEIDTPLWRNVMQYWTEAQVFDGGFSERLERYGGTGLIATNAYTALGSTALLTALDMASGVGGRRCNTYLASRRQLRAIDGALEWLDRRFGKSASAPPATQEIPSPFIDPFAMQWLGEVSGLAFFNDRRAFTDTVRTMLRHFDSETALFGVRGKDDWTESPSLRRTAEALLILGAGGAPTVCQRIVVGEDEHGWMQYNGDVAHLVRYMSTQRGHPLNWRRTSIDRSVRELAEVPLLLLSFKGPFDWGPAQWGKLRAYVFAGGSIVVDISERQGELRSEVLSSLESVFPEFHLVQLPADSPLLSPRKKPAKTPPVKVMGNGLRHFLYLPDESWSCQWHLYQLREHGDTFEMMNSILSYATDQTELRSSFAPSTYATGTHSLFSMNALHFEAGGDVPAFPEMIDSLDRLMRDHFHLEVNTTTRVQEADIVWLSVTGDTPLTAEQRHALLVGLQQGRYLFVDIAGGSPAWDETYRAIIENMDGVTLHRIRRSHPIFSGKIPGTQGFDVSTVAFRPSLRTRFSDRGRCDLYEIRYRNKAAGLYSAHDIASGIGYHYFPECEGPMPRDAREIAMNACLAAYARKVQDKSSRKASEP